MGRCMVNRCFVFVFALMVMFMGRECWSANERPQGKSATYFSQGQAVFDPQNRDKSQKDAILDFQVHAITQAVGSFLSPSQMGSQFAPLQEKVLKQPGRYVETYQVFSETSASGLYRVTGQVTVLLDTLKKDLMQLGFAVAEPSKTTFSSTDQGARTSSGPAAVGDKDELRGRPRGTAGSKQEVLWLVAERWDREWNLPRDRRDPRALLATSVAQETQDYEWAVSLPESESLTPDENGNVSSAQALSAARKVSIEKIVLGTMDLRQGSEPRAAVGSKPADFDCLHRQESWGNPQAIESGRWVQPGGSHGTGHSPCPSIGPPVA